MIKANWVLFGFIYLAFFSINHFVINPVYILGVIIVFFGFFFVNYRDVETVSLATFIVFIIFVSIFFSSYYVQHYYFGNQVVVEYVSSTLFVYSILLGALVLEVGKKVSKGMRVIVYHRIHVFLIFFLIIELITRFMNPDYSEVSFYRYKDSVLYYDSNFTGIVISVFLMFFLFLKKIKIYDIGRFSFIVYFILLVLTFSRASIFAFIASYVAFFLFRHYLKYFVFLLGFISLYIVYRMVGIVQMGDNFIYIDGSFNSKFSIILKAIDIYSDLPFWVKFFGIGLANFYNYAEIFAHNILVTFIFEFGFLGMVTFFVYFTYMYVKTRGNVLFILLPVLIGGFSLFSAYSAFLFVLSSLIFLETKNIVKENVG